MACFTNVHQVNLRVKDIRKSVEWYRSVLGMCVAADYGTTVVLSFQPVEPATICLIELGPDEALPVNAHHGTHPVLTLSPEGAEVCRAELERREVWTDGSKGHFKFKDLDGNLLEAYLPGLYDEPKYAHLR